MIYSVVQILRVLNSGHAYFRTLRQVEFPLSPDGSLCYIVGNSAVVVRAKVAGKLHALKCYTSPSTRRKAIYGDRLLPAELMIPSEHDEQWVDIILEGWHQGTTLLEAIHRHTASRNQAALVALSLRFDRLAMDLLSAPWAHGDITCENIIVDSVGKLHLIDFDGSFLPEFEGLESCELGTEAFQHPARTLHCFDRTIDDYPLALISTALATVALDPSFAERFATSEGLLFSPKECVEGGSRSLEASLDLLSRSGEPFAYVIATMLSSPTIDLPELSTMLRYKIKGVHPAANPASIFCRNGLWGFVNEFNREVIPPIFTSALNFHEGIAAIKIGSHNHYINTQAQVVINGSQYQALKSLRKGTARALNANGEWVEITCCRQ